MSVGQTSWLQIQARVEVAVLSLKSVGQAGKMETQDFYVTLTWDSFFSEKHQFFVLMAFS